MAYEGYIDFAGTQDIRGWIFDMAFPQNPVTLEILCGSQVVATIVADQFRQDLLAHEKGDGKHAFHYVAEQPHPELLSARVVGKRWKLPPGGHSTESWIVQGILAHPLNYGRPEVPYAMSRSEKSDDEQAIVARLIKAYHRARADDPMRVERKDDVWSTLTQLCHADIEQLLNRKDKEGVAEYLRDAHAKGLTFGITQGELTTNLLLARPEACAFEALRFHDNLVSLAEFVGVLDVESVEQKGPWAESLHSDPQELIQKIEAQIGISIVPPQVIGSQLGIQTSQGVLSGRELCSLYAALRIKEIARDLNLPKPTVCEIGGGMGMVGFYAVKLGIASYTLIDLPLVSVLQGYFLLRALPAEQTCLYGEEPQDSHTVFVLPTWAFNRPEVEYDLLVNQDSFPEINETYSLAYLQQAKTNVKRAFFSINQEARALQNGDTRQTVVRDLVKKAGGFERACRFRHWLRSGYIEELYRVRK